MKPLIRSTSVSRNSLNYFTELKQIVVYDNKNKPAIKYPPEFHRILFSMDE